VSNGPEGTGHTTASEHLGGHVLPQVWARPPVWGAISPQNQTTTYLRDTTLGEYAEYLHPNPC